MGFVKNTITKWGIFILLWISFNSAYSQQFKTQWTKQTSQDHIKAILCEKDNSIYYVKNWTGKNYSLVKAKINGEIIFSNKIKVRSQKGKRLFITDVYFINNTFIAFGCGVEKFKGKWKSVVYASVYNDNGIQNGKSILIDSLTIGNDRQIEGAPAVVCSPDKSKFLVFNWISSFYSTSSIFECSASILDSSLNLMWSKRYSSPNKKPLFNWPDFPLYHVELAYNLMEVEKDFDYFNKKLIALSNNGKVYISASNANRARGNCVLEINNSKQDDTIHILSKKILNSPFNWFSQIRCNNQGDISLFDECTEKPWNSFIRPKADSIVFMFKKNGQKSPVITYLAADLVMSNKFIGDKYMYKHSYDSSIESCYYNVFQVIEKRNGGFYYLLDQEISIKPPNYKYLGNNIYLLSISNSGNIEWIRILPKFISIYDLNTFILSDSQLIIESRINWTFVKPSDPLKFNLPDQDDKQLDYLYFLKFNNAGAMVDAFSYWPEESVYQSFYIPGVNKIILQNRLGKRQKIGITSLE